MGLCKNKLARGWIGNVAKAITGIGRDASCKSNIAMSNLGDLFGQGCEPGKNTCKSGCLYDCQEDGSLKLIEECDKDCTSKTSCW